MSDQHVDGVDPIDPRLLAGFDELRLESEAPARVEAVDAARRAMHLAVAERTGRGGIVPLLERLRHVLTLHRLLAGAAGATLGLAAVSALGWNAPAGAPLHVVEVAHEQIALALPGIDRASLDLGYAAARLEQAAAGASPGAALDEAQRLLDDAHSHLPGDHGAAAWTRWQADSNRLGDLRDAGTRGGDDHGATAPAGGSTSPGAGGGSGADGGRGETTTTSSSTTASRSGDDGRDGGGTSTSTSTQTESRSASTSGDGGGDHGGSGH